MGDRYLLKTTIIDTSSNPKMSSRHRALFVQIPSWKSPIISHIVEPVRNYCCLGQKCLLFSAEHTHQEFSVCHTIITRTVTHEITTETTSSRQIFHRFSLFSPSSSHHNIHIIAKERYLNNHIEQSIDSLPSSSHSVHAKT